LNRVIYILGFLCLISFSLCAQNEKLALYEHPKAIPDSFKLFYNTDSLTVFDVIPEHLSKKEQQQYIYNYKAQLKNFAENGLIYFNWAPVNKYLNDLLLKITPDSLKNKLYSKVFVKRDVTNNAISMPNGHIYINVGLLANLKSEAALAFIIAHEYAHYLKKHHLKNYKQTYLSAEKNKSTYYRFMHNNKHLEIEADEIALQLLHQKNICVEDAIDVFELFNNSNKAYNLTSMRKYFVNKQVNQLLKQQQKQSSSNFNKTSLLCKNEFLRMLLDKGHYLSCVKFGLNIYDENNHYTSTYFTAEAIRRYLLLYPNNADKNIDTLIKENTAENDIIISDSSANNILKKKLITLLQELTSATKMFHQPELYFINALHNLQYPEKQSLVINDLKSYIQKENTKYIMFAKYLLAIEQETIKNNDSSKQVLFVDVVNSFKKADSKSQIDFEKQNNLNATIVDELKQWLYAKYADYKIVFIKDLVDVEFNTANALQRFFNAIDTTMSDSTKSLFFLNPDAFEVFDSLETNSIQYLKIESKENLKLKNENVFNPLGLPNALNYLLKEKNTFLIKKVSLNFDEDIKVQEKEYKGKLKLNKIIKIFEKMLD